MKEESRVLSLEALPSSELIKNEFYCEMSFEDYLNFAVQHPEVAYSAHQRMYQAVVRWGYDEYMYAQREEVRWKICDDPFENGKQAVYGLNRQFNRACIDRVRIIITFSIIFLVEKTA